MALARARWMWGMVLVLLAWGGTLAWREARLRTARRQVLVYRVEPGPWPGLSPDERLGLATLLVDHLEVQAPGPVIERGVQEAALPGAMEVHFSASRVQGSLVLKGAIVKQGVRHALLLEGAPREVMAQVLDRVGLPRAGTEHLVPASGGGDWALLELMGLTSELDLESKIQRAEAWVQSHPSCPSGGIALAGLMRLGLNVGSVSNPERLNRCRAVFETALAGFPNHPRGVHEFSYYLTDTGDQRAAMTLLFQALKAHPRSTRIWGGLAYPARTSGLLRGARKALETRDRLQGNSQTEARFTDNVHLYAGDLDRFEASLGSGIGEPPSALHDFYRGYCRLLRGDRPGAKVRMQAAIDGKASSLLFGKLAHIFLLGLEGQTVAARQELDALRDQRRRLRVPDGEFTFKLAEAYAFLGATFEAQLVAERAFDHGFTSADWFQSAPLLAPIRQGPRWASLIQHVQERQRLLEVRFPLERFEP